MIKRMMTIIIIMMIMTMIIILIRRSFYNTREKLQSDIKMMTMNDDENV